MNSRKVSFKNNAGQTLIARLELPAHGQPLAYALFAHCFTCSKDLNAVKNISRTLTLSNLAVLRFDFTGLGESEGDFSETDFSSNVEDLLVAAQFLRTQYQSPSLLVGHSLGGAAVLAAAGRLPEVQAVATIGAPSDPNHVAHLFQDQIVEIREKGMAKVTIGGRPFSLTREFLDDIQAGNLAELVPQLEPALLIMHSPQDLIVEIDNARITYERAHHPKSFISLDGADHLLSRETDSIYVAQMIATWATRYIDLESKDSLPESERQVVTRTGDEGYTTDVRAGKHNFLADEPSAAGGKDLGPTPYDFLVTSLGACTSMTLRMYADHKGWPLEEARVHMEHGKVHGQDSESNDNPTARIDQITREIELIGPLNTEQRMQLMKIADRCPVHKTLTGEIRIKTNAME